MIIYVYRNCSLVFRVAEDQLGIPSLLDPVDMAECESPDRLSILTYLSEFYHKFKAEKSPEVNKKKEDKPSSDLKRKDSCDSGVSVSPLGSVCNSPPPLKKESVPRPPLLAVREPILKPEPSPPSSEWPGQVQCNSPSSDLDNLLRQRLNISLGSPQSKPRMTPDNSERERRNLLKSMISVSGSDITRSSSTQETSTGPDRRRSLDPSFGINRSQSGETRQLSRLSGLTEPRDRFVSCTTISLSPREPVSYSWNNSVSCDVKNSPAPPRPCKENKPDKKCGLSVPPAPPGLSHLLQVKVNTDKKDREDLYSNIKTQPPSEPGSSFKSRMMKFEKMISGNDIGMNVSGAGRQVNLTCNQENIRYPGLKDVRRKSISAFPPSFTMSMSSDPDSKLTF